MPPTQSVGLDRQSRIDELLGGGNNSASRNNAVGTAFDQLFSGRLSGAQQDRVTGARKNRTARGLRGAAADAAAGRLSEGFEAGNRNAALNFLQSSLAENRGAVTTGGSRVNQFLGTQRAGDTAGFAAFQTEVAGLQSIGAEDGAGAFNARFEEALAASGGDRLAALQQLLPTTSLDSIQSVLSPQAQFDTSIAEQEDLLGSQVRDLQSSLFGPADGLAEQADRGFFTGQHLELTPELIARLGGNQEVINGQGIGPGLQSSLGAQGTTLSERARSLAGFTDENIQASIISGNRGGEARQFLAFNSTGDTVSQANLLLGLGRRNALTGKQGINRSLSNRFEGLASLVQKNVESITAARNARESAGAGLSLIDNVTEQQQALAADPNNAALQESRSQSDRFRSELFSPLQPFGL